MTTVKVWCEACRGTGNYDGNDCSCNACSGTGYTNQPYTIDDAEVDAKVLDTLSRLTMDEGEFRTKNGQVKGEIILRLHKFYCGKDEI
jgi:DnaJ-class molecular chaperone